MLPATTPMTTPTPERPVVLYDGLCGFCDASVQFLLDHDPDGVFAFAPLQGDTAKQLLAAHPEVPADLDSIVLIDGPVAAWRSRAVFLICGRMAWPWRAIAWLRFLPRPLIDLGYRFVARIRYRIWGRLDRCRVPGPAERARFLP